jgi:hypothetical protein
MRKKSTYTLEDLAKASFDYDPVDLAYKFDIATIKIMNLQLSRAKKQGYPVRINGEVFGLGENIMQTGIETTTNGHNEVVSAAEEETYQTEPDPTVVFRESDNEEASYWVGIFDAGSELSMGEPMIQFHVTVFNPDLNKQLVERYAGSLVTEMEGCYTLTDLLFADLVNYSKRWGYKRLGKIKQYTYLREQLNLLHTELSSD